MMQPLHTSLRLKVSMDEWQECSDGGMSSSSRHILTALVTLTPCDVGAKNATCATERRVLKVSLYACSLRPLLNRGRVRDLPAHFWEAHNIISARLHCSASSPLHVQLCRRSCSSFSHSLQARDHLLALDLRDYRAAHQARRCNSALWQVRHHLCLTHQHPCLLHVCR